MDSGRKERLLHLTLEILFRLTGEDYTLVKKTSSERCQPPMSEGWCKPLSSIAKPPPHPLKHEDINDKKILELTYKMIELLTSEVPIRCQDVAVYFSMEEWGYLEGHKDLYKDIMMEVPQRVTSPVGDHVRSSKKHVISTDFTANDHGIAQNTYEQQVIIPSIPSTPHSTYKLCYPVQLVFVPNSLQTVKKIENQSKDVEHQIIQTGETSYSFYQKRRCVPKQSHVVRNEKSHSVESYSKCGKGFADKSSLILHQRTHTGEKPFACSECGKCFKQKSDLVTHHRIHTGEKPYSCSECERSFSQKTHLNRHQNIHTGVKPYPCLKCGRCFAQKSVLEIHERRHTGEKPFSCLECGKCFAASSHLAQHLKFHVGK
ncbi:gastrula zinc finger protein XlCGF66.1-like [Phyllobates terribilis]|uniref:gastrula zinc finger protein XlCGF66.1-like n=1 Tax=Phyllobates terribilis TaxID=111132 RepID=UPI003CCAB7CA